MGRRIYALGTAVHACMKHTKFLDLPLLFQTLLLLSVPLAVALLTALVHAH